MSTTPDSARNTRLPAEIARRKRVLWGELKERVFWYIRLRWWVPPSIAAGAVLARLIGAEFTVAPLFAVAGFILAYNVILHFLGKTIEDFDSHQQLVYRFTYWQVGLDYASMFLLIHFTGGAASPFIFFFIFHIIFASLLLPARSAYGFAALAAIGMPVLAALEYLGTLPHHHIYYKGEAINLAEEPFHIFVELSFFAASLFITAFSMAGLVSMLRKRIVSLAELSESIDRANARLSSLYTMTQSILGTRNLKQVLDLVTSELAGVMRVQGTSVKFLDAPARELRFGASYGLPETITRGGVVEVAKSAISRRIIEGEPFVTGRLSEREMFQFGEDLSAAGVQSVLFVPLKIEDRVIGILGAYCRKPDRFNEEEVEFFRLAAGLVAIAVENARAYEAVELLNAERSRFMLRVAHNLRAPLAASIGMLDLVRDGSFGELNPEQAEYLRRVDRRARTMLDMVSELLQLAKSKQGGKKETRAPIDPLWLAGRVERTFTDRAHEKGLKLQIKVEDETPRIWGDADMIEQVMENLVSNAVKYTQEGGKVEITLSRGKAGTVSVEVKDEGIGIPKDQVPRLFTEFFRADNAKQVEETGTGLGLAIVKEIVEAHGGSILVESTEGLGTIFVVRLPSAPETKSPP